MCIQQIQQSHQYLAVASDQLRWVFCVRNRNIYLVMELCSGGELFDRIIEWLDKCSFGRRNGSAGCTLRWVYLKMGYPMPSIGLSMTDLSLFIWPFGEQPILRHTWLMNMVIFWLSEVQTSTILRLLSTAPFEANSSQSQFSWNQTLDFSKSSSRCSWCLGFNSILVIFNIPSSHLSIYVCIIYICTNMWYVYMYIYIYMCIYIYIVIHQKLGFGLVENRVPVSSVVFICHHCPKDLDLCGSIPSFSDTPNSTIN